MTDFDLINNSMVLDSNASFSDKWGKELFFPSTRSVKQYSHRIFNRYPARSISFVPRAILYNLSLKSDRKKLSVLDPFMGSGTTAIEACLQGMTPIGVELDPFARLISDVSVKGIDRDGEMRLRTSFIKVLKNWRKVSCDEKLRPSLDNIDYWFTPKTMIELLMLKTAIYNLVETQDMDFFKVVFADIIRPCSKAERQSLKPYISKKHLKTPSEVEPSFIKSFETHFASIIEYSTEVNFKTPEIKWIGDNAANFSERKKVDIAITSPPYINALDYFRCIKIESSWVDCCNVANIKHIKENQIGDLRRSEVNNSEDFPIGIIKDYYEQVLSKDNLRANVLLKYFSDMFSNIRCTFNALKENGEYHIIVGNSSIRGVPIPTHAILAELAESVGFNWTGYSTYRIKDHRLSIPRKNNGGKIEFEHVISLTK